MVGNRSRQFTAVFFAVLAVILAAIFSAFIFFRWQEVHFAPDRTEIGPLAAAAAATQPVDAPRQVSSAVAALDRHGNETFTVQAAGAAAVVRSDVGYTYMLGPQNGTNPAHWNRCEPVHYLLDARGIPDGVAGDIRKAFRRVSQVTGLTFQPGGTTRVVPFAKPGWFEAFADDTRSLLVLSFATGRLIPDFKNSTLGLGGPIAYTTGGGDPEITIGGVVLKRDANLAHGFDAVPQATWGGLLLHEIGHAMNLGHVDDATQVMYPRLQPMMKALYGVGDRAGFTSMRDLPCFPADVPVEVP